MTERRRHDGEILDKIEELKTDVRERIDEVRGDLRHLTDETKKWREAHSGEGDETTHAIQNNTLQEHAKALNQLRGIGVAVTFIGLTGIWAWIKSAFGGKG